MFFDGPFNGGQLGLRRPQMRGNFPWGYGPGWPYGQFPPTQFGDPYAMQQLQQQMLDPYAMQQQVVSSMSAPGVQQQVYSRAPSYGPPPQAGFQGGNVTAGYGPSPAGRM